MIIVGSHCGGFDFYTKDSEGESWIWLGAEKDSDLDCFFDLNEIAPRHKNYVERFGDEKFFNQKPKPNWRNGIEFPYKRNEKLYIPEDKTYLCRAIRKKLKSKVYSPRHVGYPYDIYDKEKNYVTTIKYRMVI